MTWKWSETMWEISMNLRDFSNPTTKVRYQRTSSWNWRLNNGSIYYRISFSTAGVIAYATHVHVHITYAHVSKICFSSQAQAENKYSSAMKGKVPCSLPAIDYWMGRIEVPGSWLTASGTADSGTTRIHFLPAANLLEPALPAWKNWFSIHVK